LLSELAEARRKGNGPAGIAGRPPERAPVLQKELCQPLNRDTT